MGKIAKKKTKPVESDSETNSSDEELQEAFAAGLLKPGLNVPFEKEIVEKNNNIAALKKKLNEFKLVLPWIERLDVSNSPAPMAPEFALELQTQEEARARKFKNNNKLPQYDPNEDPVLNDFKRETTFHRQAQAALLNAIPRIKKLGIPISRPKDYFAEMIKTDEHMHKVRENIAKQEVITQRSEKVRQLRQQRKVGKQMQIEATLKKHAAKKEMLDEIKKYRKGTIKEISFLDNNKKPTGSNKNKPGINKKNSKKNMKDSKFGFGGKKRGSKINTRDSAADISDYRKPSRPGAKNSRGGKNTSGKGAKNTNRPGKNRRVNMKSKRK